MANLQLCVCGGWRWGGMPTLTKTRCCFITPAHAQKYSVHLRICTCQSVCFPEVHSQTSSCSHRGGHPVINLSFFKALSLAFHPFSPPPHTPLFYFSICHAAKAILWQGALCWCLQAEALGGWSKAEMTSGCSCVTDPCVTGKKWRPGWGVSFTLHLQLLTWASGGFCFWISSCSRANLL